MNSPIQESVLEGARIAAIIAVVLPVLVGLDALTKHYGYEITLERMVALGTIIVTLIKMFDKGTWVADKLDKTPIKEIAVKTPEEKAKGLVPF